MKSSLNQLLNAAANTDYNNPILIGGNTRQYHTAPIDVNCQEFFYFQKMVIHICDFFFFFFFC